MRHTKIIATIGPATSSDDAIRDLVRAGVDVMRLNFSHGTHETHAQVIARIRSAAEEGRRAVAILQDLSGPKIRTGPLAGDQPLRLEPGDELTIAVGDAPGVPGRVSTAYAALPSAVRAGDLLLFDDGRIQARVEGTTATEIHTTIVDGGQLGAHKGINVPGVVLPSAGLTPKDAADLAFGVSAGVDFVALSFVQSAADVQRARAAARAAGAPEMPIVAKLERPEGIAQLDGILQASDAVMVARGDLGLELPLEVVPRVQKQVTRRARALGVPVIVATQVLESMRSEPRPTRAEVSDAANAVDDRVDAIMLAGETAIGAYPVRAVQTLDAVIRDAESIPAVGSVAPDGLDILPPHGRAICEAAVTLASHAAAAAIVAITHGGKTARVLSALRPGVPIVGVTDQRHVAQRLVLSWGVSPVLLTLHDGDIDVQRLGGELVERGVLPAAAPVVFVRVTPELDGQSNFLRLARLQG